MIFPSLHLFENSFQPLTLIFLLVQALINLKMLLLFMTYSDFSLLFLRLLFGIFRMVRV